MDEVLECRRLLMRVVRLRSIIRSALFHSAGRIHNGYSSGKRNTTPQTFFRNLAILRRCLYRERELMRIIDQNFPQAIDTLQDILRQTVSQDEKREIRRLLRGYRMLWNSMQFIGKRMHFQAEFVEKQDYETFYRFLRYLNGRSRLDSTIVELIVQPDFRQAFKKKFQYLKEKHLIGAGINLGLWIFILFSFGNWIPLPLNWRIPTQIALVAILFTISSFLYINTVTQEKYNYYNRKRFDKLLRG